MRPAELIIKKRNQQELNPQEINEFVRMVVDGTISDAQIGILIPHHYQWRIQDFPQGGRQLPKVLLFFNFLPKTA